MTVFQEWILTAELQFSSFVCYIFHFLHRQLLSFMCMVVESILRLQMTIRAIVKLIYTDRLFSSGFYFHSFDTHKQNIVFFCHRLERECDFNSFKLPKRKSIECDMCLMFIATDCKIVPNSISISVSGYFCDHWEATLIWIHSSSEHITLVPIVGLPWKGNEIIPLSKFYASLFVFTPPEECFTVPTARCQHTDTIRSSFLPLTLTL